LIKELGDLKSVVTKTPDIELPENVNKIREFFMKPKVTSDYTLTWREPDADEVVKFLCGERDFTEDRVRKALEKMKSGMARPATKTTLERYFS
jgi:flap endonuclease-1